jgi:hypothetical protein
MTQAVNMANFANNLDSSGGVNPSALNAAVPISKGGTNSTTASAARTALGVDYVTIGQLMYPVGSIYINSGVTTNPATLLGFGTWVAFGAGRVPVGLNAGDPLFDTLEETGGSKNATLVEHQHTGTTNGQSNDHNHGFRADNFELFDGLNFGGNASFQTGTGNMTTGGTSNDHNHTFSTTFAGSSATNANLQPYITVAMWKRTA